MSVSKVNFNDKNEAFIIIDPINEVNKDDFKKYLDLDSPFFLKCEFENDKVFTLFYAYEDYIPLKSFLSQKIEKNTALSFLKSLTKAFIEAEKEELNLNHILLGVNSVFCHPETKKAACVYVPVIDGILPERPLRMFLKELLVNMVYSEEDDMTWLGNLIRYLSKNRQLDNNDFYEYLNSLDQPMNLDDNQPQNMDLNVEQFAIQADSQGKSMSDTDEIDNINSVLNSLSENESVHSELEPSVTAYLYRRSDHSTFILDKKDMHIGKATSNEICIKDNPIISRVHAIISYMDGEFVLQDNNSTNHTFVNGFVLHPDHVKVLSPNDRILLGNEEFIFKY